MKVTIVGTLPPIKGISEYCIEQVNHLSKFIEIEFINFKSIYPEFLYPGGTKELSSQFTIRANKKLQIRNILTWCNPLSWLKAGLTLRGEIIHIHWWTYYLFPVFITILVIAKIKRKKIICTLHNVRGHETNIVDWFLTKIILLFPHTIIVHSQECQRSVIKEYHISGKKIAVIPYGVLSFYKRQVLTQKIARSYLNIPETENIILFFGCIRKYKGLEVLLRAFSIVRTQIASCKLITAGECWEDWELYSSLIRRLHLEKDVILDIRFIPTDEVQYYYAAADLFVLPYSHFESQSGPGTIGLAFGKAMIVSKVGSLPLLVKNKNCIVSTRRARDYAKAILAVLQNRLLLRELEKDSRSLATVYAAAKSARMTYGLYKSLRGAE